MKNSSTKAPKAGKKAPATKPAPLGLDLGGLGEANVKKSGSVEYPLLPDNDSQVAKIALAIRESKAQIAALTGTQKANIKLVTEAAVPYFFNVNADRDTPYTGVQINADIPVPNMPGASVAEKVALVVVTNSYPIIVDDAKKKVKAADVEAAITEIVGAKIVDDYFPYQASVAIDITQIDAERQQAFLDGLKKLVAVHGAKDALALKVGRQANDQFHAARNTLLTVEQNVRLQKVYPATVVVKG